jgi:antitoxin component of MazEF toxin-antitoxin module
MARANAARPYHVPNVETVSRLLDRETRARLECRAAMAAVAAAARATLQRVMMQREETMPAIPIVAVNGSAAIVLPPDVLHAMGLGIGDALEIAVTDDRMILRRVDDPDRRDRVEKLIDEIFEERRDAYERLA